MNHQRVQAPWWLRWWGSLPTLPTTSSLANMCSMARKDFHWTFSLVKEINMFRMLILSSSSGKINSIIRILVRLVRTRRSITVFTRARKMNSYNSLCQMNTVHTLVPCLSNIHFNISLSVTPCPPSRLLLSGYYYYYSMALLPMSGLGLLLWGSVILHL
jgi:hypothetical protein